MKKLLLLAGICLTLGTSAQSPGCDTAAIRTALTGAGYYMLDVPTQPCSMYFVNPTSQSSTLSEQNAQQFGAHMVSFQTAQENQDVLAALYNSPYSPSNYTIWIGLSDAAQEGTFIWLDGAPVNYTNWASGEPNDLHPSCCNIPIIGCQPADIRCSDGEDCVQMYGSGDWNDLGCDVSSISVIEVNLCPQLTTSPDTSVCPSGTITLSASTILGSTPYTYSWTPGSSVTNTATVTPAVATTYNVHVADRWGCYAEDSIAVSMQNCPPPVTTTCNLQAIRTAFTGAGYYELTGVVGQDCSLYFINPTSQNANLSEQAAQQFGAHLVVFNDAAENTAVVAALNAAGVISSVDAVWVGYSDEITEGNWITLDGTPMSYLNWAPGEPNNNGQGASCCSFPDWLGGCSTSEAWRCQYGEDCAQIYSSGQWNDLPCNRNSVSVIEVNLCPQLTSSHDTTICGGNSVTLSASTLLGSTPYAYTWTPGSSNVNTYTVSPTVTTPYVVHVADRWSCSASDTILVTVQGGGLQSFTISPDTVCENQPTIITYTGNSATSASYTWGFDGGTVLSGIGQGPYQVVWAGTGQKTITLDAVDNGCTSPQVSGTLTINPNPVADAGSDVTVCSGGTIQLGTAPVSGAQYIWQPSAHLSDSLSAQPMYSSTNGSTSPVTSMYMMGMMLNGCYDLDTVNVTVNAPAATTISAVGANPVCAGGNVDLISDSVFVGYLWSDGSTANTINVSQPGSFSMGAVAADGCQYLSNTIAVTFNPPAATTISANGPVSFCDGGSVTLSADSVFTTYLWSDNSSSNSVTATQSGSFSMQATDANDCQFGSNSITVTVNPNPVVTLSNSADESCYQSGDAFIAVAATTGASPYSYVWNTVPAQSDATALGLTAGSYEVTATDANNCTASASFSVSSPTEVLISVDNVQDVSCFGYSDGSVTLSTTGGNSPYHYQWNGGNSSSALLGVPAGTYAVTVSDANNCSTDTSIAITEPAEIVLQSLVFDSVVFGTSVPLNIAVQPSSGTYAYNWNPGNYLSCTDCDAPDFGAVQSMKYQVTVTDAFGCTATGQVKVNVLADKKVFIPNAFTPNNDMQNDYFNVFAVGLNYYDLSVFNRWGEKVFDSNNATQGWDGTYAGKEVPPGVYTYVVLINFLDGETRKYKGAVTLLR